jgi:cytochrome P450 / NADPH-cytochrome P450 reductase
MSNDIPGPYGLPFLGNIFDMDMELPIRGLERLADQYGPIYQITLRGQRQIICSSAEMMEELTDEKRFVKLPPKAISELPGPKGLFAAKNDDPDWAQAHRILMPSFAPLSVQDMFDGT